MNSIVYEKWDLRFQEITYKERRETYIDVILFGIPHAGGASNMFKKWEGLLDPHIKLFPVELLGHGKRIYDNS